MCGLSLGCELRHVVNNHTLAIMVDGECASMPPDANCKLQNVVNNHTLAISVECVIAAIMRIHVMMRTLVQRKYYAKFGHRCVRLLHACTNLMQKFDQRYV